MSNTGFTLSMIEPDLYKVVWAVKVMQKAQEIKTQSWSPLSFGSFCKTLTTQKTYYEPRFTITMTQKSCAQGAYSKQGLKNQIQWVSGEHTKFVLFTTFYHKVHCCIIWHVKQRIEHRALLKKQKRKQ